MSCNRRQGVIGHASVRAVLKKSCYSSLVAVYPGILHRFLLRNPTILAVRRYLLSQLGFEDALPPVEAPQVEADVSGAAETLGQLNLEAAPEPPQLPEGDGMDFFENEG